MSAGPLFWLTLVLTAEPAPDAIVVGAGPGGLSTALEAARGGARVTVVDQASVFGGHAVVAEGGLSFPGSPLQASLGIRDSAALMYQDILRLGETADPAWARLYTERSLTEVHDWLQQLGVQFKNIGNVHGNTVSRYHLNPQRGFGVVAPIYRACLQTGRVQFVWNTRVERLVRAGQRVVGVEGVNQRKGEPFRLRAAAVVLATGGFQSNLALVRQHWPPELPRPTRLLAGAGVHASGAGLTLGTAAGAATHRLDHQWNYPRGIPDPRFPGANRGLSLNRITFPWLNQQGQRFVQERSASHLTLGAVLRQPGARAWLVFDEDGKRDLEIAGTDWGDWNKIDRLILGNPDITTRAASLDELAGKTGLPAAALDRTLARWNQLIADGEDPDFGRFSKRQGTFQAPGIRAPRPVRRAPFYAIALSPVTRKSLGGLAIDLRCRVLDRKGRPIGGLYAVGEVTGFGGLNGRAALEGTFIAPSLLQGRMVGGAVAGASPRRPARRAPVNPYAQAEGQKLPCEGCHPMEQLTTMSRKGYWHFERVHQRVLAEKLDCLRCHAEMTPFRLGAHQIDRVAQITTCGTCHLPTHP